MPFPPVFTLHLGSPRARFPDRISHKSADIVGPADVYKPCFDQIEVDCRTTSQRKCVFIDPFLQRLARALLIEGDISAGPPVVSTRVHLRPIPHCETQRREIALRTEREAALAEVDSHYTGCALQHIPVLIHRNTVEKLERKRAGEVIRERGEFLQPRFLPCFRVCGRQCVRNLVADDTDTSAKHTGARVRVLHRQV